MQSEDLSDQDFQPNKRPRVCTAAKPASRVGSRCPTPLITASVGPACVGKENLPPEDTRSALVSKPTQRLGKDCDNELEVDLLPVRKAKCCLLPAIKRAMPACHQQPEPPVAVRAFFIRRSSWSTHLNTSKHHRNVDTDDSQTDSQLEKSQLTEAIDTPPLDASSAACLEAASSQTIHAADQARPFSLQQHSLACTAHGSQHTRQTGTEHSLSASIAAEVHAPGAANDRSESLPGNFIVLDSSDDDASEASDDPELADMQTQAEASQQAVVAWLHQHGLSAYTTAFEQAEVDLDFIPWLNDDDLKQMGVTALGPRRKILAATAKLAAEAVDSTRVPQDISTEGDAMLPDCAEAPAIPESDTRYLCRQQINGQNAFSVLMKQARQGKTGNSSSDKVQKPTDALSMLMQQARGAQIGTAPEPSCSHRGQAGVKPAARSGPFRLPNWQMVPGTSFVVDKFGGKAYEAAPRTKHWFLTHFHADHYGGLGPRFKQGTIYCSPITARLVQQRLKVPAKFLHTVALHSPFQVAGVTVTFVDAHHCPGAVMILFEAPGKLPLLHTGDCRCHTGMQEEQCLQRVRGAVDLVLDTTYCNPQYVFPKQEEVLEFVLNAVKAEAFNEKKTLFLFGSYTIGKEKLFLEVARNLKQKIYVSVAKRKVLECLELPAELASLMTSNDKETNLHAVPLWSITFKSMTRLLKHYRGRYTTIVGFQPTGWTQKQDRGKAGQGRRRHKGTLITYQVPYSEHSSFPEMHKFVSWLRPRQIIPSVGNDYSGPKAARMVSLLRSGA